MLGQAQEQHREVWWLGCSRLRVIRNDPMSIGHGKLGCAVASMTNVKTVMRTHDGQNGRIEHCL
jgi:hypothetical protein